MASSSKSVGKGNRKIKDTEEEEDWLKMMAQAYVDSKTKPVMNHQFSKCIQILTEMGCKEQDMLKLQMVLKDEISL